MRHVMNGALGVEPLGNILHQRSDADGLAVVVDQRCVVPLGMDDLTPFDFIGQCRACRARCLHQFQPHRRQTLTVLRSLGKHVTSFADYLTCGIAKDGFGRGVPGRDAKIHVPFNDAQRRAFEVKLQAL